MGGCLSVLCPKNQATVRKEDSDRQKLNGQVSASARGTGTDGGQQNPGFVPDADKERVIEVEMKDMEIQTETEVQAKPPPKKENDDLIRLQSSMSTMQEDHLKERKLLNDKIAQLQHVIDQNKVADQSQQKTRPETDLENIEAPEKPLPSVPLEEDRKEDTSDTADLTRDKAEEKNEETIRQVESTEIQNHEKEENFAAAETPSSQLQLSTSSSSSSSESSSNEDGAESRSLKSQQTVKEVALTEFKSEEIKLNEPPGEPSTVKEQQTETEPISATKSQSSRRDSLESTQSERDSKLAKLKNIMQESTENLAKIDDKQNQAASGFDAINSSTGISQDPFAQWDSIGNNLTTKQQDDVWPSSNDTPVPTSEDLTKPTSPKRSISSSSSSSSDSSKPDGSLENDIFNAIKKQNSISQPAIDLTLDINPVSIPDQTEKSATDWISESSLEETIPTTTEAGEEKTQTNSKKDPFASSSDSEVEDDKKSKESQIHSMLDMWNKKYEVASNAPASTNLTLAPPGSVNLVDIKIDEPPQEVIEPTKPSFDTPIIEPDSGTVPDVPSSVLITSTTELGTQSETARMEKDWGISSSSSDEEEEEKTQISNQIEKVMTPAAKSININSTDDEIGETELESDIDGVSVIPDASQSTVADNDDRNDFINESIQIENAAKAMKLDATENKKVDWGLSSSDEDENQEMNQTVIPKTDDPFGSSSTNQNDPFKSADPFSQPPTPSESNLLDLDPFIANEPKIISRSSSYINESNFIPDAVETGGETDIFSDEAETEAETDAEKKKMEPLMMARHKSSSSSNSSWSSSDNEQTKEM